MLSAIACKFISIHSHNSRLVCYNELMFGLFRHHVALKDEDVDEAQKILVASRQRASVDILQMVKGDKMERT